MKNTLKFILCGILIMSMCFTSFAAVGGNDGSAFITKAEFDALVNDFNEQMDKYEVSLVSKIDGAIANYLNGVSREKVSKLSSIINNVDLNDRTFWNNTNYGDNPSNGNTFQTSAGTFVVASYSFYRKTVTDYQGYVRVNSYRWDNGAPRYFTTTEAASDWKIYYRKFSKDGVDYYSPIDNGGATVKPLHRILCMGVTVLRNNTSVAPALPSTTAWTIDSNVTAPGLNTTSFAVWNGQPSSTYVTHGTELIDSSDKFPFLKFVPGGVYPSKFDKSWYGIIQVNRFDFDSGSQQSRSLYYDDRGTRVIKANTGSATSTSRTTDTFTYKYYTQKLYSPNVYDWINYSATELFGDVVYKINGLPLCTVEEECVINIPLNITNSTGKSTVAIMDDKFTNAAPSESQKDKYAYFNSSAGDALSITIEHKTNQKKTYWLKVIPNNANETAIVKLDGDITQVVTD